MGWNHLFQQYLQDNDLAIVDVVDVVDFVDFENDINPETSQISPLHDVQIYDDGTFEQDFL